MRIDAIVCCVGDYYMNQFRMSIRKWLDTLDSLTLVTSESDHGFDICASNLTVVRSDIFRKHGAFFNKAAGLVYAYQQANPSDWCLQIDADVVPPPNWRMVAEKYADKEYIYGAGRHQKGRSSRKHIFKRPFVPIGYFQLWHTSRVGSCHWPIFDLHHAHAGAYDMDFVERWRKNFWGRLPFFLEHLSEPRVNWFGSNNSHMMVDLKRNPKKYRMEAHKQKGVLEIPDPEFKFRVAPNNPQLIPIARACRTVDPFRIRLIPGDPTEGWRTVTSKEQVELLLKESKSWTS